MTARSVPAFQQSIRVKKQKNNINAKLLQVVCDITDHAYALPHVYAYVLSYVYANILCIYFVFYLIHHHAEYVK